MRRSGVRELLVQNTQSPNVIGMRMSQQNRRDSPPLARDLIDDLLPAGDVSACVDDDDSVRPSIQ